MVSLPAQRPAMHANGRRCTWMYETRNETVETCSPVLTSCGRSVAGPEFSVHLPE
jgi:hypothetical protein